MPTERFKRLPEEKIEAIRRAGIQEFTRTSPECTRPSTGSSRRRIFPAGASIHILRANTIFCGGSSATGLREHNDFYVQDMEENGGDIWLTLSRSLEHTIIHANDGGFMGMITKLIESKTFFDLFKESTRGERGGEPMDCKWSYLDRIYGLLDQTRFPMDLVTLTDLMDLHAITMMMALKKTLNGECGAEEAMDFYNRRINLLRYGVCPSESRKGKNRIRKRRKNMKRLGKSSDSSAGRGSAGDPGVHAYDEEGGAHGGSPRIHRSRWKTLRQIPFPSPRI